jgi:hypothetical protein
MDVAFKVFGLIALALLVAYPFWRSTRKLRPSDSTGRSDEIPYIPGPENPWTGNNTSDHH